MNLDFPGQEVQDIELSEEQEAKLVNHLSSEIRSALNDRAGLMEKCRLWEEQANSRRQRKDAGPRDSNIDIPLTRKKMIAFAARLSNPIMQQERVYTPKPKTPAHKQFCDDIEALLDNKVDKFDFGGLLNEYIYQFCTFPCSTFKTPYIVDTAEYKRWEEVGLEEYETYKEMQKESGMRTKRVPMDDESVRYFVEVEGSYDRYRGCKPEIVPIEDFIFPKCASSVESAEWVAHRIWLTKQAVKDRIRSGVFREKIGDQKTIDVLGQPKEERERIQSLEDGRSEDKPGKQYALYECYLRWSFKEDEKPYEIICVIDLTSNAILRCVPNFYQHHCRPFVTHCYRPMLNSIYGYPMTYDLEPLHLANSASFNQRLDMASKANEVAIFVPPGHKLLKDYDQRSFRGGVYESTANKDEIFSFNVSQPVNQLPQLEAEFDMLADLLVSLNPSNFGIEQSERPTAAGTIQLIEEGKQPLFVKLEALRKTLSLLAHHILARERQFNPSGMKIWTTEADPQTGDDIPVEKTVEWPDGAIEDFAMVEISVTSAQMSKNIRKQEITALADKIPMIYQQYMTMVAAASNPQDPTAIFAAKLLKGYQTIINNMLTEFEVQDRGKLNPDLIEEAQVVQQIQQLMQQMQSQIQSMGQQINQLQAQNQQLQAFAGPRGVVGAPGPPAGIQGPPPGIGRPPGPMPPPPNVPAG